MGRFFGSKNPSLFFCEKRPLEAFLDRSTPLAEAALPRARRSRIDVPTPFASNARVTHSTRTMPLALAVSFRAPVGGAKKTQAKPIRRGGVVAPVAVLASDKCVALTAPNDARARFRDQKHDTRAFSPRRGLPSRSPLDRARHPGEMPTPHARRGCVTTVLKPRRLTHPPLASTETRQALDRRPGDPRREARRRRRYVTATRRPTRRATRSTRPFRFTKKKKKKPTNRRKANDDSDVHGICFFPATTRRRDAFRVRVVSCFSSRTVRERLPPHMGI